MRRPFTGETVFTKEESVVGRENDDGVFVKAMLLQGGTNAADHSIHTRNQTIVVLDGLLIPTRRSKSNGPAVAVHAVLQEVGHAVEVFAGRSLRQRNRDILVEAAKRRVVRELVRIDVA